ncbi:MAG: Uma2 family endonuclease [Cyanobacteria bacterium P01_F01_bin.143]
MLINAQLPISSDHLNRQDQTLRLADMNWDDYEQLLSDDYPGYLASFFNGVITLMSPSINHEKISQIFPILIAAYCRQFKLTYFPRGSTTLKKKPLVGKEPDVSYAFGTDKDIPDLAIEVIFSSGGIEDLEKYRILGVPEVWFWQNKELTFYRLGDASYQEIAVSVCLPKLVAKNLVGFVNRGMTESPLTIEADFNSAIK